CLGGFFRAPQLDLGLFRLGDVARDGEDGLALDRDVRLPSQPTITAVAAAITVLEEQRVVAALEALLFVHRRRDVVGVHEVRVRPTEELGLAPAEYTRPRWADAREVTVDARDRHEVERMFEE